MGIVKVEKINLVDEVYKQIRQQITSGNWKEGEKIASENQLTESFAVSRVVIREALQRLRSERFIVTKQGIGSFVSNPKNYEEPDINIELSEGMYEQLVQFRKAVEYTAVELSAIYATEEDYKRLHDCADAMNTAADNLLAFSNADYEFHYAVVVCAHNELLEQAMSACKNIIIKIFMEMNRVPWSHGFGVDMHYQIADAIASKDTKKAIELYDKNIKYNMARLSEFYGKNK